MQAHSPWTKGNKYPVDQNLQDLSVLALKPKPNFVDTAIVGKLTERALFYLRAGYPVHLSGPAGTGKTTMAMHMAAQLGRPVVMIHGDDEFRSSDLIGGQLGYRSSKIIDNYIHSVVKREENVSKIWVDNRLSTACRYGFTLIYDEFNRSRAEANNVLLSILEERLLELPSARSGEGYVAVHPNFSAIFTSNPDEYAGVHKTQDALMDRMITIHAGQYDEETETAITVAKSGLSHDHAAKIVNVVRRLRSLGVDNHHPTIRASLMIGRLTALRQARPELDDSVFVAICRDVLSSNTTKMTRDGQSVGADCLDEILTQVCGPRHEPDVVNGARHSADRLKRSGGLKQWPVSSGV
jgi:nitric oxide reductase NorQ protein